ncbi:MAG: hypothetical protein NT090_15415 [Acidobacteria bacterium]|nr:hypothetical protein [Acidobacteriota bacterium]
MQPTVATSQASAPAPHVSQRVFKLQTDGSAIKCLFSDESSLTLSRFLAGFIRPSDQLEFDCTAADPARELRVVQNTSRRPRELYFAPIGYVTQPKPDKRDEYFVRAAVTDSRLGVKHVHLPNKAVRDYFYFNNRRRPGCEEQTLYDLLRTAPSAAPVDLRLALKVRLLELQTEAAPKDQLQLVERAFNLLAHPDLRSCYQTLLLDRDAPALFPYGGFGALLAAGELSPDRETFFARKILSFLPDRREWRFRAPLRKIEFFDGYAVYRDSRRKAEVILDSISLPLAFDSTWNQWRHLVSTKVGIAATFVKGGKYRLRSGEWHLVNWETALPSRLKITLPGDVQEVLANARKTYHRFGQFFDAIQGIRLRLEREPLDRRELAQLCDELRIPPEFDVAQISWRADYDSFYYNQLSKRTRKMFLFREEYIFELERAIVVEVPQQGHATYVFSRPANLDQWVRSYARSAKDNIRQNRGNSAEQLGFLGRVMHGRNPRTWLRELRAKIGEPVDYSLTVETS